MQNISFIGLGAMGTPMALNLLKKKYNLFLYDINTKNYKKFNKSKAKTCNNYKDLSSKSDVFISMLPDGKALSNLVLGKNGIINFIKKNSIFIDYWNWITSLKNLKKTYQKNWYYIKTYCF